MPIQKATAPHRSAPPRILCVEDDPEIAQLLSAVLDENGFAPTTVYSAERMDAALTADRFDLIILDLMLPDEDGLMICERLRATSGIPIMMVTALAETSDCIRGLERGADDYVTKPFDSLELLARIRALLRRVSANRSDGPREAQQLIFDGWRIDPVKRQLHDPTGLEIVLTTVEFDLLFALCCHPGEVMSREQLIDVVHGGLVGSVERSIDVHISRIRQKMEPNPGERRMIKTIRLAGYLFTPTVARS
jgi:two-component system OmpR family response regulator